MDGLLSFATAVAAPVLVNIITELVTGKIKAAREREVRDEVDRQIRQTKAQLPKVSTLVLIKETEKEVVTLVERHPRLIMVGEEIRLKYPIKKTFIPFRRRVYMKQELNCQINDLQQLVVRRREEFGLPVPSEIEKEQLETILAHVQPACNRATIAA